MPALVSQPPAQDERLYTLEEFMRMDFDEKVELVEGRIVHMGWNNFTHGALIAWLCRKLGDWAEKANWGWITGGDTGVHTKQRPDTVRGADVACISFQRYAGVKKKGKVIDVGAELLVEVVSPSNSWEDIQDKIAEYRAMGTDEIWVISPKHRSVTTYKASGEVTEFIPGKHESVTSDSLPGFRLSLPEMAELIRKTGEEPETSRSRMGIPARPA